MQSMRQKREELQKDAHQKVEGLKGQAQGYMQQAKDMMTEKERVPLLDTIAQKWAYLRGKKTGAQEPVEQVKETVSEKVDELKDEKIPLIDRISQKLDKFRKPTQGKDADEALQQGGERTLENVLENLSQKAERHRGSPEEGVKQTIQAGEKEIQGQIRGTLDQLASGLERVKGVEQPEKLIKEQAKKLQQESGEAGSTIKDKVFGSVQGITGKITGIFHHKQEETQEGEHSSIRQRISGGLGNLEDKLSTHVENVQGKIAKKSEESESKKFHKVGENEGFTETVGEYKHEKRVQELGTEEISSSNPFEPLADPSLELAQPLEKGQIVGGQNVLKMTENIVPGSIEGQALESEEKAAQKEKSIFQKLGDKFSSTQEKITSKFGHKEGQDKENLA